MEDNWNFYHVGVIVRDITKAVEHYQSLGCTLGTPRFPIEFFLDSRTYLGYEVYGKTPESLHNTKVMYVNLHSFLIELMQPLEGESLYKKFLDNQGEGVHHIAFTVDNLEEEAAKLIEKGFPVITKVKRTGGSAFAYFDTSKVDNIIIELVQPPKP